MNAPRTRPLIRSIAAPSIGNERSTAVAKLGGIGHRPQLVGATGGAAIEPAHQPASASWMSMTNVGSRCRRRAASARNWRARMLPSRLPMSAPISLGLSPAKNR